MVVHVLQLLKKNVTERLGSGSDDAAPIKVHLICLYDMIFVAQNVIRYAEKYLTYALKLTNS